MYDGKPEDDINPELSLRVSDFGLRSPDLLVTIFIIYLKFKFRCNE
jgi:hypothetical protein